MARRRSTAVVALVAAFVVGAVGSVAIVNPRGYVALYPLDHAYVVFATTWLLAGVGLFLLRPRWWVVALLAIPAASAFYVTGFATLYHEELAGRGTVVRAVASPDGRYQARVTEGGGFFGADIAVVVRTRRGLLSTERTVWSAEDPRAIEVRFAGPHRLDVVDDDGTVYPVTF